MLQSWKNRYVNVTKLENLTKTTLYYSSIIVEGVTLQYFQK